MYCVRLAAVTVSGSAVFKTAMPTPLPGMLP